MASELVAEQNQDYGLVLGNLRGTYEWFSGLTTLQRVGLGLLGGSISTLVFPVTVYAPTARECGEQIARYIGLF